MKQKLYTRFFEITRHLRDRMVSGEFPPGARLPTRIALQEKYDASPATVQKALDLLHQEGFTISRGRLGTFVTDNPPHLRRVGLLFDAQADEYHRTLYDQALDRCASYLEKSDGVTFRRFYGLGLGYEQEAVAAVMEDAQAHRLSGLIFTRPMPGLADTPLVDPAVVPSVVFSHWNPHPTVPQLRLDACREPVLQILGRAGRKRFGLVHTARGHSDLPSPLEQTWRTEAKTLGLELIPWGCVPVHANVPQTARVAVNLLLKQEQPPDALIILDDNLHESVAAAVLESGRTVPDDLLLVGQCNFPFPPRVPVPMERVGYDLLDGLRTALTLIAQQRNGQAVPMHTLRPAIHEAALSPEVKQMMQQALTGRITASGAPGAARRRETA